MDLTSPLPFRHQREVHLPKPLEIPATALPPRLDNMDSATETYPRSNSPPTSTPPPRSPLPPHKLAKIANALGVNTPMPAFFRSPSPSGSASFRAPSRYLLHVVPPIFLPSEEDDDGSDPDGASAVSASSYRSQFRRGTLIPLYPTLHSQLGAIAREYNLPSTGGLVLYLIHSSQDGAQEGPRISEDVWKLLWHKALQAERQDSQPRSTSTFNLRSGRSTPTSPFNNINRDLVQSLSSTPRLPSSPFPYPSPSTSSTPSSEVHLPLSDKNNASTSDLSSVASDFTPNPFLPILAKVEFDIDRRKAGWFDAWIHGKRERSRWRSASDGGKLALELPERAQFRSQLRPTLRTDSSAPSDYMPLDDGEGEGTAVDGNGDHEDQDTVVLHNQDPVADLFGSDAATWGEMHARRQRKPPGLGFTSPYPELVIPPGNENPETRDLQVRDEDEVINLWDKNKRPKLPLNPPDLHASPRKGAPPPLNIISTPDSSLQLPSSGAATGKSADTCLPYLNGRSLSDSSSASEKYNEKLAKRRTGVVFGDLEVKIVAEPEEMSEEEIAHRSSQVVMKHKLDQLEKQLAQLSPHLSSEYIQPRIPRERSQDSPLRSAPPHVDRFNIASSKHVKGARSLNPSLRHPDTSNMSTPVAQQVEDSPNRIPPRKDSLGAISHTRPPQSQEHKIARSSRSSSGSSFKSHYEQPLGMTRPSGTHSPRAPLPPSPSSPPTRSNLRLQERLPPQLTLKRASVEQHVGDVSEETRARSLNDVQELSLPGSMLAEAPNSPVIPLSPDPFGKRPVEDLRPTRVSHESPRSAESRPPSRLQGTVLPPSVPENGELETQTSRFSADSEQSFEQLSKQRRSRSSSVMSVRGFRNLWRKSTTSSKPHDILPPVPTEPSPTFPPHVSRQHSREESLVSQRSMRSPTERILRPSATLRPDSGMDPFQFDNANIYKSPPSSSLASATTGLAPSGANYASITGSVGKSKGILKGRPGNPSLSDAEARRMHHSSPERSMSTASASLSDFGERSADSQQTSPPPSPPDVDRVSMRRKQTPPIDPGLLSHFLPTVSAMALSRYPNASSTLSIDDDSTVPLSDFEIVPPTRSTPTSSYTGEVY